MWSISKNQFPRQRLAQRLISNMCLKGENNVFWHVDVFFLMVATSVVHHVRVRVISVFNMKCAQLTV